MTTHDIKTANGIYTVKVPTGRFGARHFSLMKRAQPKNRDEDGHFVITDEDEDRNQKCFEIWSAMCLEPAIEKYPENIGSFENMPGEDQFAIWQSMYDLANVGLADGALFHIEGFERVRPE